MKTQSALENRGHLSFSYQIQNGLNQREAAGHICMLRSVSDPLHTGILVHACYWPFSVPNSASIFSLLWTADPPVGLYPTNKDYNCCLCPSWTVQLYMLHMGIILGTAEQNRCSQMCTQLQVPSLGFKQQFDGLFLLEWQGWIKLSWYPTSSSIWVLSYQLSAQLFVRSHS